MLSVKKLPIRGRSGWEAPFLLLSICLIFTEIDLPEGYTPAVSSCLQSTLFL